MKKKPEIYQQGDVVMIRIDDFPEGERTQDQLDKDKVLALGEVTNHAHRLVDPDDAVEAFHILNRAYLSVLSPVALKHEEHHEIVLPPGKYERRIVVEADHLAGIVRRVAD